MDVEKIGKAWDKFDYFQRYYLCSWSNAAGKNWAEIDAETQKQITSTVEDMISRIKIAAVIVATVESQ